MGAREEALLARRLNVTESISARKLATATNKALAGKGEFPKEIRRAQRWWYDELIPLDGIGGEELKTEL